jgi:hypothetical protein
MTPPYLFSSRLTDIPPDRLTGMDAFMSHSIVKWVASEDSVPLPFGARDAVFRLARIGRAANFIAIAATRNPKRYLTRPWSQA